VGNGRHDIAKAAMLESWKFSSGTTPTIERAPQWTTAGRLRTRMQEGLVRAEHELSFTDHATGATLGQLGVRLAP